MLDLLEVALGAAAAGAAVLMVNQDRHLVGNIKDGEVGNLVTEVDLAAERAIRAYLRYRRPCDAVSGEELDTTTGTNAEYRWSIDPLDGTTNFIRGIPYFATSVAVQHIASGRWMAGVVDAPALGKIYLASNGGGAFLRRPVGECRLTGPDRDRDRELRLLATGFSYDSDIRRSQYRQLEERMSGFADLRRFGSAALAICSVAEGAIDSFHEADLGEYDWAAGALIAEEAGVVVARPTTSGEAITVG